jgi:autoinducer 2-degrading protein
MLIRIVKMTFEPEKVDEFLTNFHANKHAIRAVEGCNHLELLREQNTSNIFMTYSYWDGPEYLENYRHSDLFKSVWSKTKPLFSAKPEAWSVDRLVKLD